MQTQHLDTHSLMQILAPLLHSDLNNASQSGHCDVKKTMRNKKNKNITWSKFNIRCKSKQASLSLWLKQAKEVEKILPCEL